MRKRKNKVKNDFVRIKSKTFDLVISSVLMLFAVAFYIVGGLIKNNAVANIIFSVATSFIATFLISLIDKLKNVYFSKRAEKMHLIQLTIKEYKEQINENFESFKRSSSVVTQIANFTNYYNTLKLSLSYINQMRKIICLEGEPFTTNFMALTRYLNFKIDPIIDQEVGTKALISENEKRLVIENVVEMYRDIMDSTHRVIIDLLDNVYFQVTNNFFVEEIKDKLRF